MLIEHPPDADTHLVPELSAKSNFFQTLKDERQVGSYLNKEYSDSSKPQEKRQEANLVCESEEAFRRRILFLMIVVYVVSMILACAILLLFPQVQGLGSGVAFGSITSFSGVLGWLLKVMITYYFPRRDNR